VLIGLALVGCPAELAAVVGLVPMELAAVGVTSSGWRSSAARWAHQLAERHQLAEGHRPDRAHRPGRSQDLAQRPRRGRGSDRRSQLVGRVLAAEWGRIEYGQGPGFHLFPAFDTKELHCQQEP